MASHSEGEGKRKDLNADRSHSLGDGSHGEIYGRGCQREDTPPAPCSMLCGPRSCSTLPPNLNNQNAGNSPNEPKRRRLWGLRGLVKMFRRRVRRKGVDSTESPHLPAPTLRTRSASELAVDQANRSSSGPYNQGLSVSHDSVFSPESPTEEANAGTPALALVTRGVNMAELKAALRRRRADDSGSGDDDPGLPRSPQTSPTTLDVLNHGLKSSSRTTQSTCSDGSLLSMGSSENDEDSFGASSHHSSRASLIEGRYHVVDHEPAAGAVPLSHKAARHKMAVRPRRTHAIPRTKRPPQVLPSNLPTTPEVNEESLSRIVVEGIAALRSQSLIQSSVKFDGFSSSNIAMDHETVIDRETIAISSTDNTRIEEKQQFSKRIMNSSRSSYNQSRLSNISTTEASSVIFRRTGEKYFMKDNIEQLKHVDLTKSRQKSDPVSVTKRRLDDEGHLNGKQKEQSNSPRSSSVEGRLEGNGEDKRHSFGFTYTPVHPVFRSSPDGEVSDAPLYLRSINVHGKPPVGPLNNLFSTSQETLKPEQHFISHSLVVESKTVNVSTSKEQISVHSSSYCTGPSMIDSNIPLHNDQYVKLFENSAGKRSSIDNLTTTPLPGIYIRPFSSHNQNLPSEIDIEKHFSFGSTPTEANKIQYPDLDSGPLSLDSSIMSVQYEEESVKKCVSLDKVNLSGDHKESEPSFRKASPTVEAPTTSVQINRSLSISSPSSSLGQRSRQSSTGDDLESDSESTKVNLRRMKREPSFSKPKTESGVAAVPEFMRIQLNRVENKGIPVVFDTEQEISQNIETTNNIKSISYCRSLTENRLSVMESEKPKEEIEILIKEKCNKLLETENKKELPSDKLKESKDHWSVKSPTIPIPNDYQNKDVEEIVLRRPSIIDRSVILDLSVTSNQTPSAPSRDEPELMKVFARRSFKLKDSEIDDTIKQTNKEISLHIDSPTDYPTCPLSKSNPLVTESTNISPEVEKTDLQPLPTLRSISAKRYSLGSCPIPFGSRLLEQKNSVIVSSNSRINLKESTVELPLILNSENIGKTDYELTAVRPFFARGNIHDQLKKSFSSVPSPKSTENFQGKPSSGSSDGSNFSSGSESSSPSSTLSNTPISSNFSRRSFSHFSAKSSMQKGSTSLTRTSSANQSDSNFSSAIINRASSSVSKKSQIPKSVINNNGIEIIESNSVIASPKSGAAKTNPVQWPPRNFIPMESISQVTSSPRSQLDENALPSSTKIQLPLTLTPSKIIESIAKRVDLDQIGSESSKVVKGETESKKTSLRRSTTEKLQMCTKAAIAEARNTTFGQSFVGTQLGHLDISSSKSTPSKSLLKDEGDDQPTADWKVLIRKRREDRMKQTKSTDADDIIIETRPTSNRNSKVLEMANNFQKLQVA